MNNGKELTKREEMEVVKDRQAPVIAPVVDIYENDKEILLHADMPGVTKEQVNVNVDNGKLSITGTRSFDKVGAAQWEEFGNLQYRRTFSVPQSINVNGVNAVLRDGVLELHLPKSEAAEPRQIQIKAV